MADRRSAKPLLIAAVAEDLALSFANTRYWRGSKPVETLAGMEDVLVWLARSAGDGRPAIKQPGRRARADAAAAARLFDQTIVPREALYRAFAAMAAAEPVRDSDFAMLSNAVAQAPPRDRIVRANDGFAWYVQPREPSAAFLLAPVLWSAGDLMTGPARQRIRRCANDDCLWLFLDESKSGTRRWCDMATCGNRAKARRHYERSKGG
jgi:predicted RNA-binding Zn ribbon-like protein